MNLKMTKMNSKLKGMAVIPVVEETLARSEIVMVKIVSQP